MIRKKFGEVVSPTTVVLLQELERFNTLIKRMEVSLATLRKVHIQSVLRAILTRDSCGFRH